MTININFNPLIKLFDERLATDETNLSQNQALPVMTLEQTETELQARTKLLKTVEEFHSGATLSAVEGLALLIAIKEMKEVLDDKLHNCTNIKIWDQLTVSDNLAVTFINPDSIPVDSIFQKLHSLGIESKLLDGFEESSFLNRQLQHNFQALDDHCQASYAQVLMQKNNLCPDTDVSLEVVTTLAILLLKEASHENLNRNESRLLSLFDRTGTRGGKIVSYNVRCGLSDSYVYLGRTGKVTGLKRDNPFADSSNSYHAAAFK